MLVSQIPATYGAERLMEVQIGDLLWRMTFNQYTNEPEVTAWKVIATQSGSFGGTDYIVRNRDYGRDDIIPESNLGVYAFPNFEDAVADYRRFVGE